jgi:hypothetical protein
MHRIEKALRPIERLEWFASTEIWVEAIASVLGFYLFIVHVLTTDPQTSCAGR